LTDDEAKAARLRAHIFSKIGFTDERLRELDDEEQVLYCLCVLQSQHAMSGVHNFFDSPAVLLRSDIESALEKVGAVRMLSGLRASAKIVLGSSDPDFEEYDALTDEKREQRRDDASQIFSLDTAADDELDEKIKDLSLKHFSERGYELVD
jgi:hypothetical protein